MADGTVSPQNDGSVGFAADLMLGILENPPPPEPGFEPDEPVSRPAPAPEPAPVIETSHEPAQAASDAPAVTQPEPAKQPVESQELSTRLQEAAKKVQEAEAVRSQYLNALNTIVPQLESRIKGEFADIKNFDDLQAIAGTDPDRYNRYVIAMAQLNHAQVERDKASQDDQRVQSQRLQEWKQQEQQKLGTLIPELKDNDKGPVLAKKIQDFALKSGYTAQQLSNASANDFVILHRAMQFDDLQGQQKVAQDKAKNAPPVQKPGVARVNATADDKFQEDFSRLQKSGSQKDAAQLFKHFVN
jgi:hypothetical protein